MFQAEYTIKDFEVKQTIPQPSYSMDPQIIDKLQAENHFLKQELDRQIVISKQLELKARDVQLISKKFENLTSEYSELTAKNRSLELNYEELIQKSSLQEQELRNYRQSLADRSKIEILQEKIDFQDKRIDELLKEIEVWKGKYQDISAGKEREIEELKIAIVANSQTNVDKQAIFLKAKYESDIEKLNLEIKRLADLLQGKTIIIEELRAQEEQIRVARASLNAKEIEVKDLQGRLIVFSQEKENLTNLNRGFIEELNDLKGKLIKYQGLERLEEVVTMKTKENELLVQRIKDLEMSLKDMKTYEEKLIAYENRIAMLASEIERLKGVNKLKEKSVRELEEKYVKLETKYTEALTLEVKLQEAEKSLDLFADKVKELNDNLKEKGLIIEELQQKLDSLQEELKEINDLKLLINSLREEYAQIEALLNEKLKDIELLQEENIKYETLLKEKSLSEEQTKDYEERITFLIRELDELREKYSILEVSLYSVTEYEAKIREFESRIAQLTEEIERLLGIIKNQSVEIEEWAFKYHELETLSQEKLHWEETIKDLEARNSSLKQELEALRQHDTSLGVQYSLLLEKIADYEKDFVKLGTESENLLRINKELSEKNSRLEITIKEIKITIDEKDRRVRELEDKANELHHNLKGKHEEVVKMKGFIDGQHNKLSELETLKRQIMMLEEEKKSLFKEIDGLKSENSQLKRTITLMMSDLEAKSKEFENLKFRYQEAMKDIEHLTLVLQKKDQELNNLESNRFREYENKIALLSAEIERLKLQLRKKDELIENQAQNIKNLQRDFDDLKLKQNLSIENDDWKNKYIALENKYMSLENKAVLLSTEIERLRKLSSLNEDLLAQKEELGNKLISLLQELENFKTENQRLKDKIGSIEVNGHLQNEIEILTKMKQQSEEESKQWKEKYGLLESKMAIVISEYESLQKEIEKLKKDVELWRGKYEKQESEFQEKLFAYENKISLMAGETERLKKLISKKEGAIENEMRQSGDWRSKLILVEELLEDQKKKNFEMRVEIEKKDQRTQENLIMIVLLYSEIERLRILAGL